MYKKLFNYSSYIFIFMLLQCSFSYIINSIIPHLCIYFHKYNRVYDLKFLISPAVEYRLIFST